MPLTASGPQSPPVPQRRLDSWKAIADYLGRDVRTAIRWEKERQLPVRRVPGGRARSVFAFAEELDAWMAGAHGAAGAAELHQEEAAVDQSAAPRRTIRRWPVIVAGLVITVAAATMLPRASGWRSAPIATAAIVGQTLVSYDADRREVWRYDLPAGAGTPGTRGVRVVDIDGDDRPDVLVLLQIMRFGGDGTGSLIAINGRGRLLWQRSLDDQYQFGATNYGPTWFPEDAIVYRNGGAVRIATTFHHHTWWPDVVATFDADGRVLARFVNAGWLQRLNVTRDGRYLLASGVSNALGGAVLAVLDAAKPGGTAPSDGGSLPACTNCPPGAPRAYLVVPWSDLAQPAELPVIVVQVSEDGVIELRAVQRGQREGSVPELIVTLSPSLEVIERTVSDKFREAHDLLARAGQLTHLTEACPWLTPQARLWTPDRGWREIK